MRVYHWLLVGILLLSTTACRTTSKQSTASMYQMMKTISGHAPGIISVMNISELRSFSLLKRPLQMVGRILDRLMPPVKNCGSDSLSKQIDTIGLIGFARLSGALISVQGNLRVFFSTPENLRLVFCAKQDLTPFGVLYNPASP